MLSSRAASRPQSASNASARLHATQQEPGSHSSREHRSHTRDHIGAERQTTRRTRRRRKQAGGGKPSISRAHKEQRTARRCGAVRLRAANGEPEDCRLAAGECLRLSPAETVQQCEAVRASANDRHTRRAQRVERVQMAAMWLRAMALNNRIHRQRQRQRHKQKERHAGDTCSTFETLPADR